MPQSYASTRGRAAAVVLALSLVALAGCAAPAPGQTGSPTATGIGASLKFVNVGELGWILTDGASKTLYVFTNDEPGKSNCYTQCAVNWPPLLANTAPTAPANMSGDIDLVSRTDGSKQVAYKDQPLYYYVKDLNASEAKGDGVGGVWFVVRPPTNSQMLDDRGGHAVSTQEPTYFQSVTGFYASPNGTQAKTGVVMIHEWWGLNDQIKDMAEILASHGYSVLAVDLFHGNVAENSQEAQAQVGSLDQSEATANMRAAATFLRDEGATQIVSLGWCFGGGQSLKLATSGETLVATIIYYGFLDTNEANLTALQWPVLGIFGEKDTSIPPTTVRKFETALNNLSIENDIYIYPEVGHAFANPSGNAWAPDATKDAWVRTLAFLEDHADPGA